MSKAFAFLFLIILLPVISAYELHDPILLENIVADSNNPHIIEGLEISNPTGDCLKIINSKNIIIRNNYFHDCGTDNGFQNRTDHYSEGYAVLIGDSENIIFEDNNLNNNFRGFMGYNTPNITATKNKITKTTQYSPLWCERCSNSDFSFNFLSDNGDPTHFWVPSDRSIGIWIKRSDNIKIHDNTVIRSTSDGISVTGHIYSPSFTVGKDPDKSDNQADWTGLSTNAEIYNNLILDNLEQGIWLVNARNIKVYNNVIRTGCFTYGAPISTEFNVGDSEFYNNEFLGCLVRGVGGTYSFNISVHDNNYYSFDKENQGFINFEGSLGVADLGKRQGAEYQESSNNTEKNNKWLFVTGALSEEMLQKLKYAHHNKTYVPKGWVSCEKEDGTIDQDCVKQEEAKGNQGVPREQLFFSSLMSDFDVFVKEENISVPVKEDPKENADINKEQDSKQDTENLEKTNISKKSFLSDIKNCWKAILVVSIFFLFVIFGIVYYFKHKG